MYVARYNMIKNILAKRHFFRIIHLCKAPNLLPLISTYFLDSQKKIYKFFESPFLFSCAIPVETMDSLVLSVEQNVADFL